MKELGPARKDYWQLRTEVADGKYFISTVHLTSLPGLAGLDTDFFKIHNYETMAFLSEPIADGVAKGCCESVDEARYDTLEEAEAGHKVMCKKWDKKGE